MAPTRDAIPLTKSPFRALTAQVRIPSWFSSHLVETLDRILRATRCMQSFAQTLPNYDVEIIKFPSGYLSKPVSDLGTCYTAISNPTNEITSSDRPSSCRICACARSNDCIAPSWSLRAIYEFPSRRYMYACWNVSGDIHRVVERVHAPELHNILS